MKTVILCGGKGTRIREVSEVLPKPMIPIGNFPMVKHIMDIYSAHGYGEFILCLGYKGETIKDYFLGYMARTSDIVIDYEGGGDIEYIDSAAPPATKLILAETGLEAMTGCRVRRIQKYVGDESFFLTYGDGLGNLDIGALAAFHRAHGKLATITSVRPPSRFGELELEGTQVKSFEEKPQAGTGHINGGFMVCEPGVFDYIPDDETCMFEREPLQHLARDGQLMTYHHDGFWMCMDTSREYDLLNKLWASGKAPWLREC